MAVLTIIRGLPGSGKSTLGREIQREQGGILVEPDAWMYSEGKYEYSPDRYMYAFEQSLEVIHVLGRMNSFGVFPQIIFADVLCRISDVETVIRMYSSLQLVKLSAWCKVIDCRCTVEESLKRNVHRVREEDIRRMAESWESWQAFHI